MNQLYKVARQNEVLPRRIKDFLQWEEQRKHKLEWATTDIETLIN